MTARHEKSKKIWKILRLFLLILLLSVLVFRLWSLYSIRKTVRDYNYLLTVAYRDFKPEILRNIALPSEVRRTTFFVSNYMFEKQKPEMKLEKLDFKSIGWGLNSVEVRTEESWLFKLIELETSRYADSLYFDYEVLYELKRFGLNWKIKKVTIIKEKRREL